MARHVTDKTRLGRLVLACGFPAYKVAGDTGIAFTQMSRYINLHEPIQPHHLRRLSEYFGVEPEAIVGLSEPSPSGTGTPEVDGRDDGGLPGRTEGTLGTGSPSGSGL